MIPSEGIIDDGKNAIFQNGSLLIHLSCLIFDKHVSKKYLKEILDIQSRITLYNYIEEIRNYFSNFAFYIMEIYYDSDKKEYILDLRKKG